MNHLEAMQHLAGLGAMHHAAPIGRRRGGHFNRVFRDVSPIVVNEVLVVDQSNATITSDARFFRNNVQDTTIAKGTRVHSSQEITWVGPSSAPVAFVKVYATGFGWGWVQAAFVLLDGTHVTLAGLGGPYCSKNLPRQPGTGQTMVRRAIEWQERPQIANVGLHGAGASAFTMTAAQALDEHLTTNNCAGCSDMTSSLRQLTFAFKAAVLTDTGVNPIMALNMSTALAMTAYGSGTDKALGLVLGPLRTYTGGPCTDDDGHCLGNFSTPSIPTAVQALEAQLAQQIQSAIKTAPLIPQPELVNMLVQGFAALVNQISFELAKLNPLPVPTPQPLPVPLPPTLPIVKTGGTCPPGTTRDANGACVKTPSTGWTTGEKIAAGIGAGVVLTGVALVVYNVAKRS